MNIGTSLFLLIILTRVYVYTKVVHNTVPYSSHWTGHWWSELGQQTEKTRTLKQNKKTDTTQHVVLFLVRQANTTHKQNPTSCDQIKRNRTTTTVWRAALPRAAHRPRWSLRQSWTRVSKKWPKKWDTKTKRRLLLQSIEGFTVCTTKMCRKNRGVHHRNLCTFNYSYFYGF